MRSHSTKNQLKEKSPEAIFIRSNTLWALLLFKVQKFSFSVIFSFDSFSHAATVHLARCSRPRLLVRSFTRALGATLASVAPWPACAGVSCGGRLPVTADREENGGATPFGTAQIFWWLRVAFSVPAHACGTVAVAQHARSALSAADGPAPPRSVELALNTQTPASLAQKQTL